MKKTKNDFISQRLNNRNDIILDKNQSNIINNSINLGTKNLYAKKKQHDLSNYYTNQVYNNYNPNHILNTQDIRKPIDLKNNNIQFSGYTRNQRNCDTLNDRLNNFNPIMASTNYPLINININPFVNKHINTRNN
jgi:hypothetical protein